MFHQNHLRLLTPTLALIGTFLLPLVAAAQTEKPDAWISDLHHLAHQIRETHPDPFRNVSEEEFEADVAAIEKSVPTLEDHQITVEFMRLVALLEDGHSSVHPAGQAGFNQQYPVMIYPFEDGIYLAGAAAEYKEYVGGKVTKIGTLPTQEAIEKLKPVINGENEYTILDRIPRFLTYPLVLHALGISAERERLELTVETPTGEQKQFTVTPVPEPDFSFTGPEVVSSNAATARKSTQTPPHLKQPRKPFWFEHRPEDNLVYVQFNQVRNAEDETFEHFTNRLFTFVDSHAVETLVLDLRYNHGGNNQLVQPLIHGAIRRNHGFNRPDHFYAILGRGTFSAAISTAAWLEEHTAVRFVGEPTGSGPIHFGDADRITLPESGLDVRISHWEWQTRLPWDQRDWFAPRVPAPPTFAAYVEGRDEAMEAILVDLTAPSLEQVVTEAFRTGGVEGIAPAFHSFKERYPYPWLVRETEVNNLGYELLNQQNHAAAIEVFRLNTETYPDSPNTWDSLAEAHLLSGDRAQAIELYKKALQVNPDFANAKQMLQRLEGEHGNTPPGH